MANFFAELKRRHIYKVFAAYVVVARLLLQLFNNVEFLIVEGQLRIRPDGAVKVLVATGGTL